MKNSFSFRAILLMAGSLIPGLAPVFAQAPAAVPSAYSKVIGEVVSIDSDGRKMSVKPDNGPASDVSLNESTSYMRVPPGEKDLKKATRIERTDIGVGDRVYARSRNSDGAAGPGPAVSVILMSKTELAQHQEKSREEWQRRGAAGRVKSVNEAANSIVLTTQTAAGPKEMTVITDAKTTFRRYSPESIKFGDARPGTFSQIAPENNVRVLGDKSDDSSSIHAEEIVSGSFRQFAGTVASVDAAANEIKLNDLATKKPVTVHVDPGTNLRKLPPTMAAMIARRRANATDNSGQPGAAGGARHIQGGPGSKPGFNGPAPQAAEREKGRGEESDANAAAAPQGAAGPGAGRAGRMDINQMLERVPQFSLADLKPGDALFITSTNGADASKANAITIVAGIEPILAASPSTGAGQSGIGAGTMTLDIGLPQ